MQVQNLHSIKYSGTVQGLKYIWRTEGFRGLFKGNGTNCARIVPNSAVKFFSYEEASKYAAVLHFVVLLLFQFVHLFLRFGAWWRIQLKQLKIILSSSIIGFLKIFIGAYQQNHIHFSKMSQYPS